MNGEFTMTKKRSFFYYILAFLTPFIILGITFYFKKITPFGNNSIVAGDMELQFVPFANELCEKFKNGNSLMYSWCRGMGYDFISEIAYYLASPLNIILLFFKKDSLFTGISLLVILKSSLCGLTMFTYLNKHFKIENNSIDHCRLIMVSLSSCYSLCAYLLFYYLLIMWFDCMIMLPIVVLCLEMLINNHKPYLYSFALGFSIFTNYYIGFMVCLFLVLYFIYYIINEYSLKSFKEFFPIALRFVIYSALGAGLSAIILIPEIICLSQTASVKSPSLFNSLLSANYDFGNTFYRFLLSASPTYPSDAKLYCGLIVIPLIIMFLFNNTIKLSKKISLTVFMSFILLSIHIKLFEFIWNAFHQPNGYVGRNTFLLIFLIILAAYESFISLKNMPLKKYLYSLLIIYFLCSLTIKKYNNTSVMMNVLFNMGIFLVYMVLFIMYVKRKKTIYSIIIFFIIALELTLNCDTTINKYTTTTQYIENINKTSSIIKHTDIQKNERVKNDLKPYKNMGSLCMYSSIPTVSSTSNNSINNMLSHFGYFSSLNATNDIAWEPVSASMFGIKYIFTNRTDYSSDILSSHFIADDLPDNKTYVYTNKFSLSTAFAVDSTFKSIDISKFNNPFELINNIGSNVYHTGNIYDKINLSVNGNTIDVPPETDIYLYCKTTLCDTTFKYDNKNTRIYPTNILGVTIHNDFYNNNYIYNLPITRHGGKIYCEKPVNSSDIIAYKINENNFKLLMKKMSANQMNISSFTDTHISGTLNPGNNKMVFTSIPFSSGWNVKIDGKKVKTFKTFNSLLSFSIKSGTHNIEFTYITPGLITGFIVSLSSIILLLFLQITKKK